MGNITIFVIISDVDRNNNPYKNQSITPIIEIIYIYNDIPSTLFVFIIFITCGINVIIVHIVANPPIILFNLILSLIYKINNINKYCIIYIMKQNLYRTREEKSKETKEIISSLQKLNLNPRDYEPVRDLYKLMREYVDQEKRIVVNIEFSEIHKRIEGVLANKRTERVYVRLVKL